MFGQILISLSIVLQIHQVLWQLVELSVSTSRSPPRAMVSAWQNPRIRSSARYQMGPWRVVSWHLLAIHGPPMGPPQKITPGSQGPAVKMIHDDPFGAAEICLFCHRILISIYVISMESLWELRTHSCIWNISKYEGAVSRSWSTNFQVCFMFMFHPENSSFTKSIPENGMTITIDHLTAHGMTGMTIPKISKWPRRVPFLRKFADYLPCWHDFQL